MDVYVQIYRDAATWMNALGLVMTLLGLCALTVIQEVVIMRETRHRRAGGR